MAYNASGAKVQLRVSDRDYVYRMSPDEIANTLYDREITLTALPGKSPGGFDCKVVSHEETNTIDLACFSDVIEFE